MKDDIDLIDQMRQLAATLPGEAGANVEQRLLSAFRAAHPRKRPFWIYIAAAALVCVAVFFGLTTFRRRPAYADGVYSAPGFIRLPYSDSGVPMESAIVIRVQIQSSELTSMGVTVPAQPFTENLKADLLIGQDGVPRAVRLIQ